MTITTDNLMVHEQRDGEVITHACATRRVAQVTAAKLALRAAGWHVDGVGTTDGNRRPLALPGERAGQLLDGSLSDQRAIGFTAWRISDERVRAGDSASARTADAVLRVDACAGLPLLVTEDRGDTAAAREIVAWYLGA